MTAQNAEELRAIAEQLKHAAEDARILAVYQPTLEKQQAELFRAQRIEEHAESIFSRL